MTIHHHNKLGTFVLILIAFGPSLSMGTAVQCPHEVSGLSSWSQDSSLPNSASVSADLDVTISGSVLLDTSPPEFGGLTIATGGRLVVSPATATPIILKVKYIHILGRMDVGSEECPFNGNLEIILKGIKGSYNIQGMGEKFIGVGSGGTLEIHGARKTSWTKLSQTIPKTLDSDYIFKHSVDGDQSYNWVQGVNMYTFNPTNSSDFTYKAYYLSGNPGQDWWNNKGRTEFIADVQNITTGHFVMMSVLYTMKHPSSTTDMSTVYNAMETAFFGSVTGQSIFRTLQHRDAYVLFASKGDSSSVEEIVTRENTAKQSQTAEFSFTDWANDVKYYVKSHVDNVNTWAAKTEYTLTPTNIAYPVINVIDDLENWNEGDTVFCTSTDYNMEQAEIARIVACPTCTSKQFRVEKTFEYMHFGHIEDRVDMRGEVGMLTRNVKVRGEMESTCPASNGNCGTYSYDTFGGHMKFVKDFENVHIEGLELEHMGQQTQVGTYPLHFHMCEDVRNYTNPPYLKDNSIHDSFARCVTIHGTDGVLVQDNVALDILGHCYFLEDGGEKYTTFDGNLGAVVREASLTPSDSSPTVFWLTNPLTTTINNVAAGAHTGFWFIFPREPIQLSAGLGFMTWANQTAITKTDNNVAHSCSANGLFVDNLLTSDSDITGNNEYGPKVEPGNNNSPDKLVVFDRFTGYKIRSRAVWIRGGFLKVHRASLADGITIFTAAHSRSGEQLLTNSVVLGESALNLGEPDYAWINNNKLFYPRSYPAYWNDQIPRQGFAFYDGPVYVENVWFNRFKNTENYTMGAISFHRNNVFWNAPNSAARNVQFGFDDGPTTGNRVFDGFEEDYGYSNEDGDKGATFIYEDINKQVVKPFPFYVTDSCTYRFHWQMALCPHKYGKLNVRVTAMGPGETRSELEMRRDDIPTEEETLTGERSGQFMAILGGTHSYTLHWQGNIPKEFYIYGDGIEKDYPVRLGICIPKQATFNLYSYSPKWRPNNSSWTRVYAIGEVDSHPDGQNYLYDENKGLLFVKFASLNTRGPGITDTCNGTCPMLRVSITSGDRTVGSCYSDAYPTYQRTATLTGFLQNDTTSYPKTSVSPPATWGAGSTKPFDSRQPVNGSFSDWSYWGQCSQSCGGGSQTRTRRCDNPVPQNGGFPCPGPDTQTQQCNTQACQETVPDVNGNCPSYPCKIFEDNFDSFDFQVWEHEITANGNGDMEFQYYTNNRSNSYVRDGVLYIKPTLTAKTYGESFLSSGTLDLWGSSPADSCTGNTYEGCKRTGSTNNIINPIQSARIRSSRGFNFKYGRIEVEAMMPKGDWIMTGVSLLPRWNAYGSWPASGEINVADARGNINYQDSASVSHGADTFSSTLHYGPDEQYDAADIHFSERRLNQGTLGDSYHKYGVEWSDTYIKYLFDGVVYKTIQPGSGGFWIQGNFQNENIQNPYRNGGTMSPFDQEFYVVLDVAVGGMSAFPDNYINVQYSKPWTTNANTAAKEFWEAKNSWYPTWNPNANDGEQAALKVNSLKVWKMAGPA